ncbi:hypothetical protein [Kurthia sibirica]|uniref:Uncharacterized protein n=1 Tax=Kurthia sibirica TaxID=202750 RepID=A0A2U3AG72_9BACL|nr:hypothetical protein [Kurthia sibirica]PWI23546.1 hypothetical protein DEX24_16035 [Kurthia sibirica]GEK35395.1 hypothetical protein KSI01_29280 [Kurthia sibirica]
MKKKRLGILGLIVVVTIILFIGLKLVQSEEKADVTKNKNSEYFQIVDKDMDKKVDVPFTSITSYRGNKDIVYMSVEDQSPSGLDNKIIQYNRKTQKYTTIFKSKFENPSVQGIELNNNWMVWVDCDEFGSQINPYIMNLDTKEIQPLAKENDKNFQNDFPILIGNYVAWIKKDIQKEKAYIMLKNLQTNETKSIFDLTTFTFRNMSLSSTDGKLLFTDEKNKSGYLYLYDVKSKEMKETKSPYEQIGWAKLINEQQLVYLSFANDSSNNKKLIFYDFSSNNTQEALSNITLVYSLEKDTKNQVYLGYDENEYLEKFRVEKNKLVKVEEFRVPNINGISAKNGIYLLHQDNSSRKKIIIQNKLTN